MGGAWSARSFFVHAHDGAPHVHHVSVADRVSYAKAPDSAGTHSSQSLQPTERQGHAEGFHGGSLPGGHGEDAPEPSVCRLFDLHCTHGRSCDLTPDDLHGSSPQLSTVSCTTLLASAPLTGIYDHSMPAPWSASGGTARFILLTSQTFLI
ncbi:hypothetical protein B7486_10430 [cyanobacterium TDX16]|nr:hypothetical protein B7486_10430 [cyanobacterium TDX16]